MRKRRQPDLSMTLAPLAPGFDPLNTLQCQAETVSLGPMFDGLELARPPMATFNPQTGKWQFEIDLKAKPMPPKD